MTPAVNSVWLDENGVFYRVKFSHQDDDRIILSRFDEPNFTTIASYLEGFERIYPRPPLSEADIDRIAERLHRKMRDMPVAKPLPVMKYERPELDEDCVP